MRSSSASRRQAIDSLSAGFVPPFFRRQAEGCFEGVGEMGGRAVSRFLGDRRNRLVGRLKKQLDVRETLAPDFLADRTTEMRVESSVQFGAFHAERVGDLRRADGLAKVLADELERLSDGCVGDGDDVGRTPGDDFFGRNENCSIVQIVRLFDCLIDGLGDCFGMKTSACRGGRRPRSRPARGSGRLMRAERTGFRRRADCCRWREWPVLPER